MAWRRFLPAGGLGFWSFVSSSFFFFCQVWFQWENTLFGLLKVSQARLGLALGWLAGGGLAGGWQKHGGGSLPVLSVYILWRSLPQARVQGAKISALPCALPQPSVSLASQQGP
jgi:hypothetical protein